MTVNLSLTERVLRKGTAILFVSLIGLTIISWLYIYLLAAEMAAGDMHLMGMGTMDVIVNKIPWNLNTFLLMILMWWVMMVGMMIPSATPMILLFARVQRKNLPHEDPVLRIILFTSSYLFLWLLFSIVATWAQWFLSERALLSPMMKSTSSLLGAIIFAVAGLYQLTPFKQACLKHCQSPLQFLSAYWRNGNMGAVQMGIFHGAYCVGCCWCLMMLLFVGGIMNLLWIAAIAIFVLLEKILPHVGLYTRISGLGMLFLSLLFALRIVTI